MSLSQLQNLVDDIVRDEAGAIDTDQVSRAIELATLQYSKDRERFLSTDIAADGTGLLLAMPEGWQANFSFIKAAETKGEKIDVSVVETLSGFCLVPDRKLAPGQIVKVKYRRPHVVTIDEFTPSTADIEALAAWAAAALLDQLATKHAGDQDSTVSTDAVNYQTASRAYASRANQQRGRYYEILNAKKGTAAAACAIKDLDKRTTRGHDRIFHRGSLR